MDENSQLQKGLKSHQTGDFINAQNIYQTIVEIYPQNTNALFLLGTLYGQIQQYKNSIATLSKVIELKKDHEEAYRNLSFAYELNKQYAEAISTLESAVEHLPHSKYLHNDLGDLYRKTGKFLQAIEQFQAALTIDNEFETSIVNMAISLSKEDTFAQSEKLFKKALNLNPKNEKTLSNYSALLNLRQNYEASKEYAQRALLINPYYPEAMNNLGYALLKQDNLASAINEFEKAIKLKPAYIDAYNNLGFTLHLKGEFSKALEIFDNAIMQSPENVNAHFYRSFTHLHLGNFSIAWDDYEYGLMNQERETRIFPFKKWNKQNEKSVLLITAEQGIGDQIMFSSCLPDLLKVNKNVILECEQRLAPLFKRSFPEIEVIGTRQNGDIQWLKGYSNIEYHLSIGSLPYFFRRKAENFSHSPHYILSNRETICKWKNRYKDIRTGLNVGISWKAGLKVDHKKRSMNLEDWLPILRTTGVNFINLQYGDVEKEIEQFRKKHGITIHEWKDSDSFKNIDDFSAKIAALDLVISVANTNVHIAGSQNIPAWSIIPQVPSWRWMDKGEHSVWYESVRLIRQTDNNDWSSVIKTISQDLNSLNSNECR